MRKVACLLVLLCLPLTACVEQTLNQTVGNLTPNLSGFNSSTTEIYGIVLTVKGCSISPERIAICKFTALSKYQDRQLNLHGGNSLQIQDDTGVSYPTLAAFGADPTNKQQRATTLIADAPYDFTIMASNLSTQATKVRAITIHRMDVTGTGRIDYIKTNFPHPPMLDDVSASSPAQDTMTATTPYQTAIPSGDMPYRYMFTRITPISSSFPKDPNLANGAYIHLREDGALGHNFSKPGPYAYAPKQGWRLGQDKLVIIFDEISYTFDLSENTNPMVTYLDQGGAYKMVAYPKAKGQK